ncbi:MAG: methionyl-tRNA formyltransferase [Prevotellaceae bacterium]|jgi:methionyl-tRNA formyltransferase|nr:methionyl-tRNA formyltransferase [Prevotellaceae bacterium]
MKIVYMGTPRFAVEPLKMLIDKGHNIIALVSSPDKPAGRGMNLKASEVKQFALSQSIPIMQPEKLRDPQFLHELRSLQADLFIVVAFRMLPEVIWSMPPLGTINLHASLLPQYRGAAPINHALINGEKTSGLTTFVISQEIDTGGLLLQREVSIDEDETAGQLHDKLMCAGAELLEETVRRIAANDIRPYPQPETPNLKTAPKLTKETSLIKWDRLGEEIRNLVRGLSPYPAAWSELISSDNTAPLQMKIFKTRAEKTTHQLQAGTIVTDRKTFMKVACADGFVHIVELQLAGKKAMSVIPFLAGFRDIDKYHFKKI